MLKTSPVLSNSANASPNSLRYAPASSPKPSLRHSPSIRRRQSTRSTGSPTHSLKPPVQSCSTQHAAPDASSPIAQMESLQVQQKSPFAHPQTTEPSHPPRPQSEHTLATVNASAASSQPKQSPLGVPDAQPHGLVAPSPNKRRGSPEPSTARASEGSLAASTDATSQKSTISKRARPDTPPPIIVPKRYEFCPVEHMVELIAHMISELITTNDAIRVSNGGLTRFHSRTAPGISVRDYLHRLARHATLTPPLLLAMVYYIDRLCALYPEFTINTLTVHRFLITAATVAAKGLSDSFWNNTTYARVGGVRVAELKLLELEFLYRVDWRIVPSPEVLVAYYKGLVERTPGYALESDEADVDGNSDEEDDGEADN